MLTSEDQQFLIATLPFYDKLSDTEKSQLFSHAFHHFYKKGQPLYNSSTQCLGLVVVLSGMIRSYLLSASGKEVTLYRFSDVMWMVEQVFFMSLDQRIAVFLLEESAKNKSDTISMTHAQIATCIGSAREAVTRMLKYMQSEHYITLFRGGVRIINRKNLYQLTLY